MLNNYSSNQGSIPSIINKRHLSGILLMLLVVVFTLIVLVNLNLKTPVWIFSAVIIVLGYFYAVNVFEKRNRHISPYKFGIKLFKYSLVARLLSGTIIVILAQIETGRSLYIGAVDGARYHRVSMEVAEVFWSSGIGQIYTHVYAEYGHMDNTGVPLVIGMVYAFTTNSVLIANLFIALLGSFSVYFIYKTASIFYDQQTAKLAGILSAFLPLSLYFDTVIMKEAFVVFFSSASIYLTAKMVKLNKISILNMILLGLCMAALFFFRTAVGAVIVSIVIFYFAFNRGFNKLVINWFVGSSVVFIFLYFVGSTGHAELLLERITTASDFGEGRVSTLERRLTWQNLALGPVFIFISHFAPFPSMIEIPSTFGYNHGTTHYWIGPLIAWNIMAYYAVLGMWEMVRKKPFDTLIIWGYTAGFTFVLGYTVMFTAVRFGWNAMPMMMIPVAIGLIRYRNMNYFYLYLCFAGFLIIAWNLFRGVGRGIL